MIYFIAKPDRSAIKIGTTIRLSQRLKTLASELGDGLEVLAVADGDREAEQALHRQLAELRIAGEWFEPGDDLMGFIVSEAKPWDGNDETDRIDIRLRVDPELHRRIQAAADQEGNSVAAFIRSAVVKELKRRESEGGK